jgi:hypothetical protein
MGAPRVRLVVLNFNGGEHVLRCVEHLLALDWPPESREIVVIDNASTDGSRAVIEEHYGPSGVVVWGLPENEGFVVNNLALHESVDARDVTYVGLVNNDAFVDTQWLRELVSVLDADPSLGAACPKILFAGDDPPVINNAGSVLLGNGYGADRGFGEPDGPPFDEPTDVFAFCGNGVVLRRQFLEDVGTFDAGFFMYYEDIDLSWRGRARGWHYRYVPSAVVEHLHAASSIVGSPMFRYYNERNRLLCLAKNAPAAMVAEQAVRYVLSTASYALNGEVGTAIDRVDAFRGFVERLPAALRARAQVNSRRLVDARA